MNKKNTIPFRVRVIQYITVVIMCGCLGLITGINFFVYETDQQNHISKLISDNNTADEKAPEKPIEEKGSSVNGGMQEEYMHGISVINPFYLLDIATKHTATIAARLAVVHYELFSPPPEC